jgi:hypothetical protein
MKSTLKLIVLPALSASMFFVAPHIVGAATKPLVNSDVVAMIKAGLPENTIILSIQQAAVKFDTAPQSLISLKKQGVSAKLLDAMLQKQAGKSAPSPTKTFNNIAAVSSDLTGVRALVNGEIMPMKRSRVQTRFSTGWLSAITGFGDSKGRAVLDGTRAKLRLPTNALSFEVALPEDVNPDDYVTLVRLEVKGDRRSIETSRAGFSLSDGARVKEGFPKDRVVAVNVEETGAKTSSGKMIYRVTLGSPLVAGEYSIVRLSTSDSAEASNTQDKIPADYYDFGVDASS